MALKLSPSLPHPLWTIDENGVECWQKTEDIQAGDRIAIARGMEQWGDHAITEGWEEHFSKWKRTSASL